MTVDLFRPWKSLLGSVLVVASSLAGCAAPTGETTAAKPELRDVPPRPALGYTIEQRRAIGDTLVADRENARHQGELLRQRTGKSALPPPPMPRVAPPEVTTAKTEPPPPSSAALVPSNPEAAIAEDRVRSESDDGSLNSFLRQLLRLQPEPPTEPSAEVAATAAPTADEAGSQEHVGRRPDPPSTPALDQFLGLLGGTLAEPGAFTTTPAVAPAAGPAASGKSAVADVGSQAPATWQPPATIGPAVPAVAATMATPRQSGSLRLLFVAESTELSPADQAQVREFVTDGLDTGFLLRIVGRGSTPSQALDRARSAARAATKLGVPASQVNLRAGGVGADVELTLVPRAAS